MDIKPRLALEIGQPLFDLSISTQYPSSNTPPLRSLLAHHPSTLFPLSDKMKSAVAAIAFAAAAQASPVAKGLEVRGEEWKADGPFYFTSTYSVIASPNQVVDSENEYTGGLEGCTGLFNYGINVLENVICYNITIDGFTGEYESPANSATHIHEGAVGQAGPPR